MDNDAQKDAEYQGTTASQKNSSCYKSADS